MVSTNARNMAIKKLPPPIPAPCNIDTIDACDTTSPMVIINKAGRPRTFLRPLVTGCFSIMNDFVEGYSTIYIY